MFGIAERHRPFFARYRTLTSFMLTRSNGVSDPLSSARSIPRCCFSEQQRGGTPRVESAERWSIEIPTDTKKQIINTVYASSQAPCGAGILDQRTANPYLSQVYRPVLPNMFSCTAGSYALRRLRSAEPE